jgi:hypothetical protein
VVVKKTSFDEYRYNEMAENTTPELPLPAVYVDGKGGTKVLLDPQGFRLAFKKTDCARKFYYCTEKKRTGCPVAVSLHTESQMIVRVKNEHNHDNSLLESAVKKIVRDKTEDAAKNKNISPRTLFQVIPMILVIKY